MDKVLLDGLKYTDPLGLRTLEQMQRAAKRARAALESRDHLLDMGFIHPDPSDPEDVFHCCVIDGVFGVGEDG